MQKLTARAVESARPPKEGERTISDPAVPGLHLRITASGVKTWAMLYRVAGRRRRLTLGRYPDLGLADARTRAQETRRDVALGKDPAREKVKQREADADTFGALAARYLEEHAIGADVGPRCRKGKSDRGAVCRHGRQWGHLLTAEGDKGKPATVWDFIATTGRPSKRSWKEDRRKLTGEIPRSWRNRPAGEISRREIRELVDAKAKDAPIAANRLRALLHTVFAFAVERDVVEHNPVTGTPRPGKQRQRQRVLTEDEIRAFWQATTPGELDDTMAPAMSAFWRLRLVTAQRAVEVSTMRWGDLDLDNAVWTIPPERSKNGLAHRVPLSALAVEIITSLPQFDPYVLAGARGNRQRYQAAKLIPVDGFKGHDLRRSAASYMASAGVPRLHIGKVLNHAERGVTAVYDRHGYDPEKRVALDTWAAKLAAIVEGREGADVVAFARRA